MQFTWRVVGGFSPQSVDLLAAGNYSGASTTPRKIVYLPEIHRLVVADGGTTAMALIGLQTESGLPGTSGSVAF